jgi:hypothetical protein
MYSSKSLFSQLLFHRCYSLLDLSPLSFFQLDSVRIDPAWATGSWLIKILFNIRVNAFCKSSGVLILTQPEPDFVVDISVSR